MASEDNINIITLARGEIMLRMVKLRGAQLNQRLPALVKSPCAARWWVGCIMRSMQFMIPRLWTVDGRPRRGEELTLFVVKNALRLLRRLRWGAKRRTRMTRAAGAVKLSFIN